MRIKNIKKIENESKRYDIQVEDNHNFYANGLLVHNSWCCIGVVPESEASEDAGRFIITSKGLSSKGLAFKLNEENEQNLYVRAARKYDLFEKLSDREGYFYVLGEVFGHNVQDLQYGADESEIMFRSFDIYVGDPKRGSEGRFLDEYELVETLEDLGINRVPLLYRGPFDEEAMLSYTDGYETISGSESHIREGVVVRPTEERTHQELPVGGRVQLKSVSEFYLTRKDGTEYN